MAHKKPLATKKRSLHVKKGDRVLVIAGKDKGLTGEILAVYPESQRVTVQGVNVVKRHLRDTSSQPQGGRRVQGGIVSSEAPVHVSNVQLVVKDDSGEEVPTRVGYNRVEVTKRRPDGTEYKGFRSVRIARKTNEEV
jgi:large subunit ribosomal protein L24